jgi:uncharacterized protein involved in exopolysaccharide biosynthesis
VNGLLDLFDLSLLWRRKWLLVLSVVVASGLAIVFVQRQVPLYEVTARVLVQRERFATDQERLVRTDSHFLATQGEILRSPVVVQPALASLQEATDAEPDFEAANAVIRGLNVSSVDDANVLKLTYRSVDSNEAIRLLHALIDTYREYSKEMQSGGIAEAHNALALREEELRAELATLEERYHKLREQSPLIGQGKEAFGAHLAMLEQLGRRLTEARSLRIDKETQMQMLLIARGVQAPPKLSASQQGVLADAAFVALRADDDEFSVSSEQLGTVPTDAASIQQELWKAEMREAETSQVYGPRHPETRAVEAQIEKWRERLKAYEEAAPVLLSQQLEALLKNETHLTKIYDAEFQKVKLLDSSLLKEQAALADIQRVQDIHDATATQLRELEFADDALASGQITTIIRMLEAPDATAKLVWPRPTQFVSLCAALSFMLGCVLVTLAERVTKRH